jgi:hypothetical protein
MIEVGGLDYFTMRWSGDTIRVDVLQSTSSLMDREWVWVRSGDTFTAKMVDAARKQTYRYTIRLDATGTLTGRYDGPADTDAESVRVGPTYRGTARLNGTSKNTDETVWATLSISLWGTNSLGNDYLFQ